MWIRIRAVIIEDEPLAADYLPGKDGASLATQLAMLPQPPRLVFTTGMPGRATDAFRLDAVDYLLKPLDPKQVSEAVNRLLAHLRPFESGPSPLSARRVDWQQRQTRCFLPVRMPL